MCREGCFSCAFYIIAIYIGTFVVMLDIEANICNDMCRVEKNTQNYIVIYKKDRRVQCRESILSPRKH
jgi:hypothetical protein